jgi:PD-(D/E)XK nuclease superfamily protein
MLSSDQKGTIAELAIAAAAVGLGIGVCRAVSDGERCDLVLDAGRLLRVQCKWAPRYGDVIIVRCCRARRNRVGLVHRRYLPSEVDAFAAYCPDLDRCYLLPIEDFPSRREIRLRLGPTRNNQKQLVNWASDYEFAARLGGSGAVAQLGERDAGSVEVTGSSPVGSIFG